MRTFFLMIFSLLVTLTVSCEKSGSSTTGGNGTTTTTATTPSCSFVNNYGTQVYVEIYTGTNLSYSEGRVYGKDTPVKIVPASGSTPQVVSNGGSQAFSVTSGQNIIVVVGVSGSFYYVNDATFSNITTSKTITLDAAGKIN